MKTIKPQLNLTNPNFKYTNSVSTDIRETFKRVRESAQNEEKMKPLVSHGVKSLSKPLVDVTRNSWGLPYIQLPE